MRCCFVLSILFLHLLLAAQTPSPASPADVSGIIAGMDVTDSLQLTDTDSTSLNASPKKSKVKKVDTAYYSPKKAALWGLAFPGLGQVYNKKYWKLPIVYGLLGGALYFLTSQSIELKKYNGYLVTRENGGQDPFFNILTTDELVTERDYYRRNVQLASFATLFVWGLSIVDATVDAHMRSFDISDNLALQVKPKVGTWQQDRIYAGLNLNLKFK